MMENAENPWYYKDFEGTKGTVTRGFSSIINSLRASISYSKVAKDHNVSVTTAIRIFDAVSYNSKPLPPVLLIDEFRRNADGEKFQCILMDGKTKEIIDILPNRKYADLCRYFSKKDTSDVRFLVSDLWKPYRVLCRVCFRKAKHIADKYHVIRQTGWAMEDVRKNEQKPWTRTADWGANIVHTY